MADLSLEEKRKIKAAYMRAWNEKNREKVRAQKRERYALNVEERRKASREYKASHRELAREWNRKSGKKAYYADVEASRLKGREVRKKAWHKDVAKSREDQRVYRHNNPDLVRAQKLNAYYRDLGMSRRVSREASKYRFRDAGLLTKEVIQQVYERNRQLHEGVLACYLCHKPIEDGRGNLEHKVPLVRGGKNELENLDVAHSACNLVKGLKTHCEYLQDPLNFAFV